jgi:hypothetical protein
MSGFAAAPGLKKPEEFCRSLPQRSYTASFHRGAFKESLLPKGDREIFIFSQRHHLNAN